MSAYQPDPSLRLSAHFTLGEFLRSQYATRHGVDMTPPLEVRENLRRLCVGVLEPLRAELRRTINPGAFIVVTSGYRPPVLNAAIGGATRSAHLTGRAADIVVPGVAAVDVFNTLRDMDLSSPPLAIVDKAILEFGQWVHVQVRQETARRQFLIASKQPGGVRYAAVPAWRAA